MHGFIFFTRVFFFAVPSLEQNFQGPIFLEKQLHPEKRWIFCTKKPSALTWGRSGDSECAGLFNFFHKSPVTGCQLLRQLHKMSFLPRVFPLSSGSSGCWSSAQEMRGRAAYRNEANGITKSACNSWAACFG